MNSNHKDRILELHAKGYSYRQIQQELGCSKGTIAYHCGLGQKEKYRASRIRYRSKYKPSARDKIRSKVARFLEDSIIQDYNSFKSEVRHRIRFKLQQFQKGEEMSISVDYIIDRISKNPHCELTGLPIDINNTRSWHLDHKLPRSRGGDNSAENLQILSAKVNQAKHNMTNEEFIELCQLVVNYSER